MVGNLPLVRDLIERRSDELEWVEPTAGPIAFPRVLRDVDVRSWCEEIAQSAGVLLLPGDVYEQPRHLRVGFGRANLPQAVARLDSHLG